MSSHRIRRTDFFQCLYMMVHLLGLVGNILAYVIYSKPKFRRTIFWVYFRFLVVVNSCQMLEGIYSIFIDHFDLKVEQESYFLCLAHLYLSWSWSPLSGFILAIVSVDRYVTICYPTRFMWRNKVRGQLAAIAMSVIFNMTIYSPIMFDLLPASANSSEISSTTTTANGSNFTECQEPNELILLIDLFCFSIIPFTFMIVFTTLTIHAIFVSKRKVKANDVSKEVRFALVSIGLNISYFVLTFPNALDYIITSMREDMFFYISDVMTYINYAQHFYVSLAVNSVFRQEFHALFWKPLERPNINQLS